MKILVTGAAGFVGRNILAQLGTKYNFLTPAHNELDLLDEASVENYINSEKPDIVIHCANVGATRKTDNLPQIVGNNVRMFLNLAKQEQNFKRMIFFGSGAEFNKREPLVRIDESFASKNYPETDYGLSKYICNHFIQESQKIVNLRLFGVYGRNDDYENRFVSNAICRSVLDLPIQIFQNQLMSFVFVDDLVKIVEHFIINEPKEKVYHVAPDKAFELLEIAEMVKAVSDKPLNIAVKQIGMANEYTCNNSRLLKELGGFKFTEMETSLKVLYQWYSENKTLINPSKFS